MKMVKTQKIPRPWLQRLRASGATRNKTYDEGQYEWFKRRLLRLGGQAVILANKDDYETIDKRGVPMLGHDAVRRKGRQSQCHYNSAMVWKRGKGKYAICTGYALSNDGVWRQHSWAVAVADGRVQETTEPFALYFGYVLTEAEAEEVFRNECAS